MKKTIALIMVMAISLSVLTGCGSKKKEGKRVETEANNAASVMSEDMSNDEYYDLEDDDDGTDPVELDHDFGYDGNYEDGEGNQLNIVKSECVYTVQLVLTDGTVIAGETEDYDYEELYAVLHAEGTDVNFELLMSPAENNDPNQMDVYIETDSEVNGYESGREMQFIRSK